MKGTEVVTVDVGDYAVKFSDGTIPPLRVERKSIGDLYGTLSKGMKRFKKKINESIEKKYRLYLFVEELPAGLEEFIDSNELLKRSFDTCIDQLNTLEIKHGVIVKWFDSRRAMSMAIYKLFFAAGKYHVKSKKLGSKKALAK